MGAAINSLVSSWNLTTDLREDPEHRLAIAILGDHINKLTQLKDTFEGHSAPNVDPSVLQAGLRDAKFTRNSYGQRALAKILGDNSHRYASMSQGRMKEGHRDKVGLLRSNTGIPLTRVFSEIVRLCEQSSTNYAERDSVSECPRRIRAWQISRAVDRRVRDSKPRSLGDSVDSLWSGTIH